ncbi:MAG: hypothetical protein ABIJ04_01830 [Bacteroidota bacterium]
MTLFRQAVIFARKVREDPSLVAKYEINVKRRQSIYHAAIARYMEAKGKI